MDIEDQFSHSDLLLTERACRICKATKNLIEDFYITHKNSTHLRSSYSYECKKCTIERIRKSRQKKKRNRPRPLPPYLADYPDW